MARLRLGDSLRRDREGAPPRPSPASGGGSRPAPLVSRSFAVRLVVRLATLCTLCTVSMAAAAAQEAPALANASAAEKARLQELIPQAIKEGQISYIETIVQPATNDALAAAFRKRYGLPASFKVLNTTGTPGSVITRLEQEMRAGRITFDIGGIASTPWVFARVREGRIARYDSPEYAAYKKAFDLGLGLDGYFAFTGGYYFVPMWSTESLNFKGTSYKDVLGAVPVGRLSSSDPSVSDPPLMSYVGLRKVLPLSFFEELAKLKPAFMYKSEQTAGRLVSGEDLLAFTGMPTRAHQLNSKGAKLAFMDPQEGVVLLTQSMFILEGAPHPAAARLWVDLVLSEEGQKILAEREYLISGRGNFASPLPNVIPTLDSLKTIKVDWSSVSVDDMQRYRAEWTSMFKR